jgi:hypothetical protein
MELLTRQTMHRAVDALCRFHSLRQMGTLMMLETPMQREPAIAPQPRSTGLERDTIGRMLYRVNLAALRAAGRAPDGGSVVTYRWAPTAPASDFAAFRALCTLADGCDVNPVNCWPAFRLICAARLAAAEAVALVHPDFQAMQAQWPDAAPLIRRSA